jgi:type IV secretion system protein VirB9
MRYASSLRKLTNALTCLGLAVFIWSHAVYDAQALKLPRPLATDNRIHTIMYGPDEVFKFTGTYGYQSSIVFEPGEEILTISLGDSVAWLINPSGNRIFLKPVEQDAETNMTVLTNKRSYLFELHAREAESITDKDIIFVMRFLYPEEQMVNASMLDEVPDTELEGRENFNFNYSIRGAEDIAPIQIFDDGEFTYFEFRDKNAEVPAFYKVDEDGQENLINYRTRDDYIVVERVANRFTLRLGGQVVCVYNEAKPFPFERAAQQQQQRAQQQSVPQNPL